MNQNSFNKIFKKQNIYNIARGVAVTTAIFAIVMSILLIANYVQIRSIDPLNSNALNNLMENLHENPNDEALKTQIRALDLLARKAYFTSQWQLKTGSFLLLGSLVLLLLSLKIIKDFHSKLPIPQGIPDADDSWLTITKARKWIMAGGVFILTTAMLSAALTYIDAANTNFDNTNNTISQDDIIKYWTNFRGPGGNGIAHTKTAPLLWDIETSKGIKWKVEVPKAGYSSPIIWKNKIFLTGADKNTRDVYCFNTENGELIWQKEVKDIPGSPAKAPDIHRDTGYAASTMATDGRYVFAIFVNADLICLDMDGNQVWAQNLGLPANHYGHSSSLIIYENLLIVQYDQNKGSKLLGLEVATGNTTWRTQRGVISWSSPIIVNTGKRIELILTNSKSVDSFDPKTGIKLWGIDCMGGEMGPSAAYADGMVFAGTDYAVVAGIRITDSGAELVWEYDDNLPDTASPIATAKYLFIATSYGYFVCLDAKTGSFLWEHEFNDGFYGSPILVGDLIYAMDMQGVMHIIKTDKEYNSIGDIKLGERSTCTPAFVDNIMYVRGDKYLYCIAGE